MKKLLLLAPALIVGACAADPDSIQPAYVSEMVYEPYSCVQLGQEQARLQNALASVSQTQRQARNQDTWGVALIGMPVSSLSGGNVASQVAQVKGNINAVQEAGIKKNCGLTDKPTVVAKAPAPPAS